MTVATFPLDGTFVADPAHSHFQFTIKHMRVATFHASFADVYARVVSDENGVRFEGVARPDAISIKTPPEFREAVVNGEKFFDATNHPEITFRSEDVRFGDDGTVTVKGPLTIKGISRNVTASGTYQPTVEDPFGSVRTAIELTVIVDRRDWGMDWQTPLPKGGDMLGWEVTLTTQLELVKEDSA